jgi:hypothetical protein
LIPIPLVPSRRRPGVEAKTKEKKMKRRLKNDNSEAPKPEVLTDRPMVSETPLVTVKVINRKIYDQLDYRKSGTDWDLYEVLGRVNEVIILRVKATGKIVKSHLGFYAEWVGHKRGMDTGKNESITQVDDELKETLPQLFLS